jgi:hypothetical protein
MQNRHLNYWVQIVFLFYKQQYLRRHRQDLRYHL